MVALETLDRLWPEYVDRMIAAPLRGIGIIASVIHLGVVLRTCEPLTGFPEVLGRIKKGEQSALSEAVLAAALVNLGYVPELGPTLGKSRLDMHVQAEDVSIYIEVISPERSDAILEAQVSIQALAKRICEAQTGMKIELRLEEDINATVADWAVQSIKSAPASSEIQHVSGLGKFIKEKSDGNLVVSPLIRHAPETTIIGAAFGDSVGGTLAAVRIPMLDERVQRLFAAELHHFSKSESNLLIADVTGAQAVISNAPTRPHASTD